MHSTDFLNSKFGLALFTAFFLTFLPWAYKSYLVSYEKEKMSNEFVGQIKLELNHRLFYIRKLSPNSHGFQRLDLVLAFYGSETGIKNQRYFHFKSAVPSLATNSILGLATTYATLKGCYEHQKYHEFREYVDEFRVDILGNLGEYKGREIPESFVENAQEVLGNAQSAWTTLKEKC